MEKTLRKFTNHDDMRAETYRYWHSRPDWEIFDEISQMSEAPYRDFYRLKGIVHAEGSNRSLTRIHRTVV